MITKRPDVWFFYAFLLTLPLTIRKVIFFYPIKRDFNEFTGIYLYLSDLFLITTLILWGLFILCNNYTFLSIDSLLRLRKNLFLKKWLTQSQYQIITFPALLVIWAFLSITWSEYKDLALFRSVKLLEFFLLYLYIKSLFHPSQFVPRGTIDGTSAEHSVSQSQKELPYEAGAEHSYQGETCSTEKITFQKRLKIFLAIFILIGLFNALLAFLQIANNGSIGLRFLRESLFEPSMSGVAKIALWGKIFVRPYGLFPHPNLLGLYLLMAILSIWLYLKLFASRENLLPKNTKIVPQGTNRQFKIFEKCFMWNIFEKIKNSFASCSTWNKIINLKFLSWLKIFLIHSRKNVSRRTFSWVNLEQLFNKRSILNLFLLFGLLALLLTFSKNAIIGLLIAIFFIRYYQYLYKHNCSTLNFAFLKPFIRHKLLTVRNILILAIILMLLVNLRPSFQSFISTSFIDRLIFQNVSRETISENLILGVGMGQFVSQMDDYSKMPLLKWQFQPVHNVFSLVWAELGLIGLILFIFFILALFRSLLEIPKNVPQLIPLKMLSSELFLAFIIMSLFDHYFWDIQQGQGLFWIIMALV